MTSRNDYKRVLDALKNEYPSLYKKAAESDKQLKILASFYNLGKSTIATFNKDILEESMAIAEQHMEPKNLNDFYTILLHATKARNKIIKNAHPQGQEMGGSSYEHQFDLDKWSNLVYKIYDAVLSNDMTINSAIDYYSETLDKNSEEDFKFKKWIKYHLGGDGNKYAKGNNMIKKKSDFQFGLNGSNFYYPDSIPMPERTREDGSVKEKLENKIDDAEKRRQILDWKNKLDGAIRRIDKLIRTIDDPVVTEELFNSLHNFNMTVQKAKNKVTASDITFRMANSFKKVGFNSGYDILSKTAQEIEQSPEEEIDDATNQRMPDSERKEHPDDSPFSPIERIYENTSGAKEGEYEKLSENIQLTDAISKLEEIAARLSDRRVIRLLAEFDIMLDKIGIASMFPELAESQSKLIDSYSYALVRVTKMLGMLSSGKNLSEISSARKEDLIGGVKKEVDKVLNPKEKFEDEPKSQDIIADEFTKPQQPTPSEQISSKPMQQQQSVKQV